MSRKAQRHSKVRLCVECGHRRARYQQPRGGRSRKWVASDDHDLCPGCYGRQRDRDKALSLGRKALPSE